MQKTINLYPVFLSLGVVKHYGTLYTLQFRKEKIILKLGSVKAQKGGQEGVIRKLLALNRRIPHSFTFF
jgi:hypothetical protein